MRQAPVTWLVLAGIGLMFAAETWLGGSTDTRVLVFLGANVPPLVWAGQWWRLFASLFIHIGVIHLLLNGYALYQLGTMFEVLMGSGRMLGVYLASGLGGALASLFFMRGDLSAGASGAIFGLLGALVGFLMRRRDRLNPGGKQLLSSLLLWAGINVVFGLTNPMIDNAGHAGGAVTGLVLGLMLRERQRPEPPYPEMGEGGGAV
jgi:rhomboid protease GluP